MLVITTCEIAMVCWFKKSFADIILLICFHFSSPSDNFYSLNLHKMYLKWGGNFHKSEKGKKHTKVNLEKHIFECGHTTEKDCYQKFDRLKCCPQESVKCQALATQAFPPLEYSNSQSIQLPPPSTKSQPSESNHRVIRCFAIHQ